MAAPRHFCAPTAERTSQKDRHLLSPLDLRGHRLRNRIVFGAHTNNMAEGGLPGARSRDYLLERALGGAAMIVCEPMPVHRTGVLTRGNYLPETDAVIVQQLYHIGAHGDSDLSFRPHWSPSGHASYHDSDGSHRMGEGCMSFAMPGDLVAGDAIVAGHIRQRDSRIRDRMPHFSRLHLDKRGT